MSYDRDEWRRPWLSGDHPIPGQDPEPSPEGRADIESASGTEPMDTAEAMDPAEAVDTAAATVARTTATQTTATQTAPITRYPQPPPAGWNETQSGPGSPVGSVRPPDTTGTVHAPQRQKRQGGWFVPFAFGLLGAVVGAVVTLAALLPDDNGADPAPVADGAAGDPSTTPPIEAGSSTVVPAVAEAVTPSVVRIDVTMTDGARVDPMTGPALGSGVIYRTDGYILTNHHVIEGAEDVTVRLSDGEVFAAEVVGTDELNDLAVLHIERDDLPAVSLRTNDDQVLVGETVIAIGSPFGLDASVTAGIVSALNRELQLPDEEQGVLMTIPSVIQTDAAINPGNSGGALVDSRGRLVGINTAILSRTGVSQGVGFAVSVDQVTRSADQLISQGFVSHPLLGITGNDVSPELAEDLDLPASRGAVVQGVEEDTGAAEADLRPGDIIVEVDGEPLATMSGLVAEVRSREPGDVVTLGVIRDSQTIQVEVTLSERPR